MCQCLHPFVRKVKDPLTGEVRDVLTPCGKCINCLHAYQDMWTIRLQETAKKYKKVLYETLTVRPEEMAVVADFNIPTKDNTLYGSTEKFRHWKVDAFRKKFKSFHRYYPHIPYDAYQLLKKNDFKVYEFPKDRVQEWFKRGRERYTRYYGHRPNCCYFLTQEYGPKTSRMHFHLIIFGLKYDEYMQFWGLPWKYWTGWTKPIFLNRTADTLKDINNIVRYVTKYICKGDWESPLVKCGLQSKPYHLISKGLGEGYLSRDFFKIFKSAEFQEWMKYHKPSQDTYERVCSQLEKEEKWDKLAEYKEYYKKQCEEVDYALQLKSASENGFDDGNSYIDLSSITPEVLQKIQIYYDENGFPHALPQYYKNKLFRRNNEKNIYQLEIQSLLQQSARLHDNKIIQQEALALGIVIPDEWLDQDSSTWKLSPSQAFMVSYNHLVRQRDKAKTIAERRKIRLDNFHNRSKLNTNAPALS